MPREICVKVATYISSPGSQNGSWNLRRGCALSGEQVEAAVQVNGSGERSYAGYTVKRAEAANKSSFFLRECRAAELRDQERSLEARARRSEGEDRNQCAVRGGHERHWGQVPNQTDPRCFGK